MVSEAVRVAGAKGAFFLFGGLAWADDEGSWKEFSGFSESSSSHITPCFGMKRTLCEVGDLPRIMRTNSDGPGHLSHATRSPVMCLRC